MACLLELGYGLLDNLVAHFLYLGCIVLVPSDGSVKREAQIRGTGLCDGSLEAYPGLG
jgi:hypothetical protein